MVVPGSSLILPSLPPSPPLHCFFLPPQEEPRNPQELRFYLPGWKPGSKPWDAVSLRKAWTDNDSKGVKPTGTGLDFSEDGKSVKEVPVKFRAVTGFPIEQPVLDAWVLQVFSERCPQAPRKAFRSLKHMVPNSSPEELHMERQLQFLDKPGMLLETDPCNASSAGGPRL